MILACLAALSQSKIKRLLAYSSIGHVGYLLVGLCCGTVEGIQALFVYLFIYIIMNLSLFAVILSPLRRGSLFQQGGPMTRGPLVMERAKYITDLAHLNKTNPVLAFTLAVTLFSMAGIPPLAGFYSKAYLFFAAMSSSMYLLAFVGVLASVVSCFYYIRLIKIMYFEAASPQPRPLSGTAAGPMLGQAQGGWFSFSRIARENSLVLGFSFFFILLFIAFPSPLFLVTHKVALAITL
jgi:proton-translocating NADH-quinone oxidoreductase chain N